MAKQAPFRSKTWLLLAALAVGQTACRQATGETDTTIPNRLVSAEQPGWQRQNGLVWFNNEPFSGRQYALYANGDTVFVGAFRQGKAEGIHRQWYENRQPREVRRYVNGAQEGEQRGWYEDGKPAFVYHFRHDVYEGTATQWFPNGHLAQIFTYRDGREDGRQQLWYEDGTLRANYVARNGRHYGLTGVKNCVNVWDSIQVAH
ncbi:hypothetical protein GCM10023187_46690 [Nibrella viscosa]|uniref:Toxin-antitoxin system YwqK family antitoxin n=1 Tax=Nibrella viscosa TaxID=1084524 RepID=A0ABP8KU19_9BACT